MSQDWGHFLRKWTRWRCVFDHYWTTSHRWWGIDAVLGHCTGMHTCFVMVTCSKLPTRSTSTWLWPCRCIPIVRIISRRTSRQLSPCSQYRFGVPHLWFRSRPESPFALGGTLTLVGRGCFMCFGNHCILLRFAYLVRNSSHCILDHTEHSVFHYLSICRVPNGRIPSHSGRASTSRYLE